MKITDQKTGLYPLITASCASWVQVSVNLSIL